MVQVRFLRNAMYHLPAAIEAHIKVSSPMESQQLAETSSLEAGTEDTVFWFHVIKNGYHLRFGYIAVVSTDKAKLVIVERVVLAMKQVRTHQLVKQYL